MRLIIIIVVCVLIEEICELLYKQTSKYKMSIEQTIRLKRVPEHLEIVNIGSGPVYYGIDYSYCSKVGYNLASAPQNFLYGYKLIKHFSNKIAKNANVVITVMAPMSFGYNTDIHRKNYSDKYYGILPANEIEGYSIKKAFLISHPLFCKMVSKIKTIVKPKRLNKVDLNNSIIDIWTEEFHLSDLQDASQAEDHRSTFDEKIELLTEVVDYIRSNKWNPVLVIPPMPQQTRENISDEFLKAFVYDNINELTKRAGALDVLNYYYDERFDKSMFINDIFLNEKGIETFSKILFKEIDECRELTYLEK